MAKGIFPIQARKPAMTTPIIVGRATLKPGQMPHRFITPVRSGCPYDCGLCPDHEQHSCLTILEVTDACNLECPICYAESGPHRQTHRSLEQVEFLLDSVVRNEHEPDIVQISGGEPTIHPQDLLQIGARFTPPSML